jgi:hypothetical protein
MRKRLWIGIVFAALLLAPDAAHVADAPTYPGKLRPVVTPILLRYAPVSSISLAITLHATLVGNDPKTEDARISMEGEIVSVGERLEWRLSTWWAVGKQSPKSSSHPFIATLVTDKRGNWTSIELSGFDPKDGAKLRKGTPAYNDAVDQMTSVLVPMPEQPISQGDDLLAGFSDAAKLQYFGWDFPAESVSGLDIRQIATGETIISGRRGIVTQLTGGFNANIEGHQTRFTINGYVVFDVASGMRVAGRIIGAAKVSDDMAMRFDGDIHGSVE